MLRPRNGKSQRVAMGSPGKRLYAVGDVHGSLVELDQLLALIAADHAARDERSCHIVFLGDLIDRGPDSRGVLRRLMQDRPAFARLHFIRGNHEEMFVRCLTGEPELIASWLSHGGHACARSYGVDPSLLHETDPGLLEQALLSCIPKADIDFVGGFVDTVRFGDYFLVHAGIRPGVALADQKPGDLRWIRADFISSDAAHEAVIVHGHTPQEQVVCLSNRISVDTGAYFSGRLSAVRLEEDEVSILTTSAEGVYAHGPGSAGPARQ
jgi:serine/threonine protein phosphatase 1